MQARKPTLAWYKNIKTDKEKKEFQDQLILAVSVFQKYFALIEEMEAELEKQELLISDFEDPSWSHKQAFRNGQRSQLKQFKNLLNFVQ